MSNERRRGKKPSGKNVLTAAMFLGKNGATGYIVVAVFLDFLDNGRPEDVDEMASFIGLIGEDLKMIVNRKVNVDRGKQRYKYENFIRPKGLEGVKVSLIGNIEQFILDYQAGKFSINFTFQDLIDEAEKA